MTQVRPGLALDGRVLVLGLRQSGAEVAKVLASRGARVLASDVGDADDALVAELTALGVDVECGSHDRARASLGDVGYVFASPGISPLRGFLADVIASGVPVVSELDLGQAISDVPVVAVTGTNGKTTVCRLAEAIGREAGLDVLACGNLETKYISAAHERADADAFVVEASSFSLQFCQTFAPRVAVVTSLAPDHLDWHGTFEHYRDAKARIASHQGEGDLYLYPAAQPELAAFATAARVVAFGPPDGRRLPDDAVEGIAARGAHFAADAAAAASAMEHLGVRSEAATRAFASFSFDRHRLEPVGTKDGVTYIDDSVATNTHATLAAIASFEEPLVLIAGGRNKGIDLMPLRTASDRLRAVVAIGEAASLLAEVFDGSSVFVHIAASIGEAVAMAAELATPGDVVLLSPSAASHDMFTNYAERGDAFIAACRELGVRPGAAM